MRKNLLINSLALLFLCSCAPKALYNWNGYDNAVYNYTKTNDEKSLQDLFKVYDELIKNTGSSNKPAPGICADYGYLLIQKGEVEKGKKLIKQEIVYYPESAVFLERILKRLEK
jgi:hypothetical protein